MGRSKIFYALCVCFFTLCTNAQERTMLDGRVLNNLSILENVYLKNISTGRSLITDMNGEFSLLTKLGDTLIFSHIGMKDHIEFVDAKDIENNNLIISMTNITNQLEEVNITDVSKINAVSLGIIPKEIRSYTQYERRLETAGDFKWIHLLGLLGGSLEVDPILNAINGRTKQLKKNIKLERKIKNIGILEGHRDFLQNAIGLSEKQIGRLIYLAAEEENVQEIIDSNNKGRIEIFLLETWLKFKQDDE